MEFNSNSFLSIIRENFNKQQPAPLRFPKQKDRSQENSNPKPLKNPTLKRSNPFVKNAQTSSSQALQKKIKIDKFYFLDNHDKLNSLKIRENQGENGPIVIDLTDTHSSLSKHKKASQKVFNHKKGKVETQNANKSSPLNNKNIKFLSQETKGVQGKNKKGNGSLSQEVGFRNMSWMDQLTVPDNAMTLQNSIMAAKDKLNVDLNLNQIFYKGKENNTSFENDMFSLMYKHFNANQGQNKENGEIIDCEKQLLKKTPVIILDDENDDCFETALSEDNSSVVQIPSPKEKWIYEGDNGDVKEQNMSILINVKDYNASFEIEEDINEAENNKKKEEITNSKSILNKENESSQKESSETKAKKTWKRKQSVKIVEKKTLNLSLCQTDLVSESGKSEDEEITPKSKPGYAIVPSFCLNKAKKEERKRVVKRIWNPEKIDHEAVNNYVQELGRVIRKDITNEEIAVKILKNFNYDAENVLATAKRNRVFYRDLFDSKLKIPKNV